MASDNPSKDWFDFMQKAWNPMSYPLPGMVAPVVDLDEIEKKIAELKTIEAWLTMNTGLIQMSIKALEMQKSALEQLRAGGDKPA